MSPASPPSPPPTRARATGRRPPPTEKSPPARRPPLGVYKVLAYLVIAAASAACAVLPLAAGVGTVAATWYLRGRRLGTPAIWWPSRASYDDLGRLVHPLVRLLAGIW